MNGNQGSSSVADEERNRGEPRTVENSGGSMEMWWCHDDSIMWR